MYSVRKRLEIAAAHKLVLPYESKCTNLHGHNWIIDVELTSDKLTEYGMVMDFKHIKNKIEKALDHTILNEKLDFNPTAENIAEWISKQLTGFVDGVWVVCTRVEVQESPNNTAIFTTGYYWNY